MKTKKFKQNKSESDYVANLISEGITRKEVSLNFEFYSSANVVLSKQKFKNECP